MRENKSKKDNNETSEFSITKRSEDYSQWYLDVISAGKLADNSPVRGCMVIRPNGYAVWEKMQKILDEMFKETGVANAYFPLFIPISFLNKEAKHVAGFAKECAVVTHHRLELDTKGRLQPTAELEEPLIVRPTSETIMYDTFSKWINSHRDLPLLINQWANIVRWEMRTRPFLRTMEFLWQEGHTAHATKEEADTRTEQMIAVYKKFCEEYLAIPVIAGLKTESEKFAGAVYTTCIEAMMQDGKSLQTGTSHMLGQNFAKAFEVKYLDQKGESQYVWQTSWGLSTRLIGALIMVHSDDKGLVLPPRLAPTPVVIVPIWSSLEEKEKVLVAAHKISNLVSSKLGLNVKVDDRDLRPGPKFYEWEKMGIPLRLELGPKDLANNSLMAVRRDNEVKEEVNQTNIIDYVSRALEDIQDSLFKKALKFQKNNTKKTDSWDEFKKLVTDDGGFILAHWCGSAKCEQQIKEATKATIACIPFDQKKETGKCILCGKKSEGRVIFAKAY
ncbi:MAG: proline--tRNA ligase [Patescibacteria group bacterium]